METINFLFKIRKLRDIKGVFSSTIVTVFDPLRGITVKNIFYSSIDINEVLFWLQTNKNFEYKGYQVYFLNAENIKF